VGRVIAQRAFAGILRALLQRRDSGGGIDLSVSLFDVIGDWMNMPLLSHRYLGGAPARLGLTHALIAPYGAYRTADRKQVLIAVQNNREWRVLCEAVLQNPALGGDPRFADNSKRVENRAAMDRAIDAVFGRKTRAELMAALERARIACAPLNSVQDLSHHACLRNLDIRFGGATISVADLPLESGAERHREVPQLNQHGAALRREFKR